MNDLFDAYDDRRYYYKRSNIKCQAPARLCTSLSGYWLLAVAEGAIAPVEEVDQAAECDHAQDREADIDHVLVKVKGRIGCGSFRLAVDAKLGHDFVPDLHLSIDGQPETTTTNPSLNFHKDMVNI